MANPPDPTLIAAWRRLLPHSGPDAVQAAFDALPTATGTATPAIDLAPEADSHALNLRWEAQCRGKFPYNVYLHFSAVRGRRRAQLINCNVAHAAPKGQGFGSAVLRLAADLTLANAYDRLELTATDDGLTFWLRQGAIAPLPLQAAATQCLYDNGHDWLVNSKDFQGGRWGPLLRDERTQFLMTHMLQDLHDRSGAGPRLAGLSMYFDCIALAAILARPAPPRFTARPAPPRVPA